MVPLYPRYGMCTVSPTECNRPSIRARHTCRLCLTSPLFRCIIVVLVWGNCSPVSSSNSQFLAILSFAANSLLIPRFTVVQRGIISYVSRSKRIFWRKKIRKKITRWMECGCQRKKWIFVDRCISVVVGYFWKGWWFFCFVLWKFLDDQKNQFLTSLFIFLN